MIPFNIAGLKFDIRKITPTSKTLVQRTRSEHYLGPEVYGSFSQTFSDVLQAFAEKDSDYLKNVMETNLFERTQLGWEEIERKKYEIHYLQSADSQPGKELDAGMEIEHIKQHQNADDDE